MDTKLKKTHKLTTLIIALVVMIPALILTALYPRLEKAANEQRVIYKHNGYGNHYGGLYLQDNFPNYVIEATYCMYVDHMLNQGEDISRSVLESYGWTTDYEEVLRNTQYYVEYADNAIEVSNEEYDMDRLFEELEGKSSVTDSLESRGFVACLELVYDMDGNISKIQMYTTDELDYSANVRNAAEASQEQYRFNVEEYNDERGAKIDSNEVVPKGMKAIFAVEEEGGFVWEEDSSHFYDMSNEAIYADIGAIFLILLMAAWVALAALILPFFKKLETGWEKPFCLSFEIMCVLTAIGACGAIFMYEFMCFTTMENIGTGELLGFRFTQEMIYGTLLVLNFIGWSIAFWLEYMVVSSFRQFLCGPKYYLKNRLLLVRGIKWCIRKAKEFWNYVTDYELSRNLHKKLLYLVIGNAIVVAIMCTGWLLGIIAVVAYGILTYVLLRKQMEKVQKDYGNIKNTVHHMAEGNLNIAIPNDLGAFQSLGNELGKVKDGFSKAVAEEAKSQNMKTELITNVSHDLKTPLTAIITYIDLLGKEGITEEERKSYLATLEKKSQRLKVLIEDLFEVSKAQSGNVKLNPMNVDVVNLMKQVRTEMEDKIADSNLSFRWNLPEEKVVLYLDGQKTYRVFENLLNNALKYSMPHSRVYVDILNEANQVQIMFRNMSDMELDFDVDHLTDRFVRGDASRNSEGSGLGLAIAKSFIELQGGVFQIDVDGDLFKVVLKFNR